MLKLGFIAGNSVYASYAHTDDLVQLYLEAVEKVFGRIADIGSAGKEVKSYLKCDICHAGFERLN